jgi:hypothetical protein
MSLKVLTTNTVHLWIRAGTEIILVPKFGFVDLLKRNSAQTSVEVMSMNLRRPFHSFNVFERFRLNTVLESNMLA